MRKKVYQYVMLFASVVMLLGVVVPHHHHADGSPCYRWLAVELAGEEHEQPAHHDCGCNGHNIALNTVLSQQATDGDAHQHLFPTVFVGTGASGSLPKRFRMRGLQPRRGGVHLRLMYVDFALP